MSNESAIKATAARIDEITTAREKELAELDRKLNDAKQSIPQLEADAAKATAGMDAKSYRAAREAVTDARFLIEMCERRQKDLAKTPAIDRKEYESAVEAIQAELSDTCESVKARLLDLVDEMQKIVDEASVKVAEGNKVLKAWQTDIYLDSDIPRSSNGYLMDGGRRKQFKDFSIFEFMRTVAGNGYVEAWRKSQQGSKH